MKSGVVVWIDLVRAPDLLISNVSAERSEWVVWDRWSIGSTDLATDQNVQEEQAGKEEET